MTDFTFSSFRIVSPTSFVYGESVDASNFIQLDDQECHFQPVNITLQVPTGPGCDRSREDQLCFQRELFWSVFLVWGWGGSGAEILRRC
jgi:hypothetical protein